MTVTILGPSTVTFALTPGAGTNAGNTAVTVVTTVNLGPGPPVNTSLYAYFADPTAALTQTVACPGCPAIPPSAFQISMDGGAWRTVNQPGPFSAASLQLWALPSPNGRSPMARNGNRAVTLAFNIDASSLTNLAAGNYAGTLNLQAQAIT